MTLNYPRVTQTDLVQQMIDLLALGVDVHAATRLLRRVIRAWTECRHVCQFLLLLQFVLSGLFVEAEQTFFENVFHFFFI